MRKIFGSIDGAPHQWLLAQGRITAPGAGHLLRVKNLAAWAEPQGWVPVRVQTVVFEDGVGFYSLNTEKPLT